MSSYIVLPYYNLSSKELDYKLSFTVEEFCIAFTAGASDSLSVKEVMNEISKEVTDYHSLGIQLDISLTELEIFQKDCPSDIRMFGAKVIDYWLKNGEDPSLECLAKAVERTDKHKILAKRLKEKAETRREGESMHCVQFIHSQRCGMTLNAIMCRIIQLCGQRLYTSLAR